jgi:hypothetical protein
VEDLGRRVERWVAAGVIAREQGEAILALEGEAADAAGGSGGLEERSGSPPADGEPGRRAVVVEVLGYLGGGLALVAGFVLGAESWAELGYWGRAGVLGAVTAALLGAGWRLRTGDGRVLPRLASMLWLGAVAAFAGLLAVLLGGRSDDAVDDPTLAVAGGALVLAGGLYLVERRVLQQVALFGAAVATMLAAGGPLEVSWAGLEGAGLAVLGAAWLELGRRGLVGPRRTSEALGGLAVVSGCEALATVGRASAGFGVGGWGLWLGLAAAVALLVAGSALRRNVLLGIGAAAMVVFLAQAAGRYWRDVGAPLAILLVGLGLVAVAVVLARLRPARGDRMPR